MKIPTVPGRAYVVTGVNGGTVTTGDGQLIGNVSGGMQMCFIAISNSAIVTDEEAIVTLSLDGATPINGIQWARHSDMVQFMEQVKGFQTSMETRLAEFQASMEKEFEEFKAAITARMDTLESEIGSVRSALNAHIASGTHVAEGERTIWNKMGDYAVKQLETAAEKEAHPGVIRAIARKIW